MNRLVLPGTKLDSSQAGFGCVGLTTVDGRNRAFELLKAAFDAGITHFDVARAYGLGRAESILGEFLRGRRSEVTITTKFGLAPPSFAPRNASVVAVTKKFLRRFPPIERRVRRYAEQQSKTDAFSARDAAASLEQSLRALRTDYIDVLLMHEGTLAAASDDQLLIFLEDQVTRGTVRYYGVGTNVKHLQGDLDLFPRTFKVFQFENDAVLQQRRGLEGLAERATITHSALKPSREIMRKALERPDLTARFYARTGYHLSLEHAVVGLLLEFARADNPNGVVLFGSTRVGHMTRNAESFRQPVDRERVSLFASTLIELFASGPAQQIV